MFHLRLDWALASIPSLMTFCELRLGLHSLWWLVFSFSFFFEFHINGHVCDRPVIFIALNISYSLSSLSKSDPNHYGWRYYMQREPTSERRPAAETRHCQAEEVHLRGSGQQGKQRTHCITGHYATFPRRLSVWLSVCLSVCRSDVVMLCLSTGR